QYLGQLPKILNKKERDRVAFVLLIIGICALILLVKLYLMATVVTPAIGGEYTEGLIGSPRFINPILAQANDVDMDLSYLIFSGLLKWDKNRQLAPDLAKSYEISSDQLTYTFYLRNDVKWHDGSPFKADDVIFTISSIQDPTFKSPLSRSFRGIAINKINDYIVKFTLKEPFAPFLGLLTVGILPEHLWYNITPANADLAELNKRPIGTGPWKFNNLKKDKTGVIKSYTLIQNPDYYDRKPYLQKIIFKLYGDFVSAVEALKSKEAQGISYLPKEFAQELKKYKNISYNQLDQPQYTAIFFNQLKNNILSADYIRQALALGTNKQKIVAEAFGPDTKIIDGPTLPGIATNPNIKKYPYDPQAAVDLLEKNGWPLTATTTPDGLTEQIRKKKDWYLNITLTTVDQPENVKAAEIIKQSWDQIGFKTTLNIIDKSKILQEIINPREYEALLFGENIGSDPDPFPFWHSSQNEYPGLNLAIFTDKKVDKILEDARKTNNWDERKKNYATFQEIIAQQLPAIFLYNPTYTYPQDKSLKGFNLFGISAPADRFANLSDWYVKTKRVWR
ncbi:peptide ABC transporter substrate-binding protein, partial [Candidatus Falkowbacteria bacterium]|nr:peptide ABC transporter substrate-binding protein [Candidatus Falkowbacteria bacterium]